MTPTIVEAIVLDNDSAICSLPIKASIYDNCRSTRETINIAATAFLVNVASQVFLDCFLYEKYIVIALTIVRNQTIIKLDRDTK